MPDIRLILGSTPASERRLSDLLALLSDDERARIDRIRLEHVRRRHTAALAALRIAVGRTLGRDPAELQFRRGPHGKPYLEDDALSFNLTRSEDRFAVGVSDGGALGIDIEFGRPIPRVAQLSGTVFADVEMAELAAFPEEDRHAAFYRGWTRKEAFIKAVGTGLHLPLRSFSVSLSPGFDNALGDLGEPALRAAEEAVGVDGEWWVGSVPGALPADLFAAVAWDRGEPSIRLEPFEWG